MAVPRSRERARSFVVGTATLAVLAVVLYVAFTANTGRLPGAPVTTVRAAFADVGQLQTGSEVRRNGVISGRVTDIVAQDRQAVVTMELNGAVDVYRDAYAGIWDQSALAQKFVELRTGTPGAGPLGDEVLPLAQTESTHDLVKVLDVFQPDTRAALGSTLRNLGGGLAGHGPGLHDFVETAPALLAGAGTVSRTLASDSTDLPALLHGADDLTGRLAAREAQIASLLERTTDTMQALGVDGGRPLEESLAVTPQTLRDVRQAFAGVHRPVLDLRAAMAEIPAGARALAQATPDVRAVLRDGREPLHEVPGVADSAEPAAEELTRVFRDTRPFAPRVAGTLDSLAEPLGVLAPYAGDIGTFAFDIGNLIENHNGWEHRLRIMTGPPTPVGAAGSVVPDSHNPYPAPGEAIRDRDADGAFVPGPGR
jgi:phospholipid/cholesterol/gamma-HCH transport system substrate-binding protein